MSGRRRRLASGFGKFQQWARVKSDETLNRGWQTHKTRNPFWIFICWLKLDHFHIGMLLCINFRIALLSLLRFVWVCDDDIHEARWWWWWNFWNSNHSHEIFYNLLIQSRSDLCCTIMNGESNFTHSKKWEGILIPLFITSISFQFSASGFNSKDQEFL